MKEVFVLANSKKMVEEITAMDVDFAKWYTDVVKKAELASYSGVRGCMVVRPYATALWENIRNELDRRFKQTGHENVMMPMFMHGSRLKLMIGLTSKILQSGQLQQHCSQVTSTSIFSRLTDLALKTLKMLF